VGWETMYAATPTWTPVDTTSSVAQSAAATSAMIADAWNELTGLFYGSFLVPGMNAWCVARDRAREHFIDDRSVVWC
jgi:hypothetical protein